MMNKKMLDIENSYKIYSEGKELIENGFCYNNSVEILARQFGFEFLLGKSKVGLCYVGKDDYYYQRHCVIIHNDKIIDLSIPSMYSKEDAYLKSLNMNYYIFKELTHSEYSNNLNKAPDFRHTFKEEYDLCQKLKDSGNTFVESEFDHYLKGFIK